MIKLNGLTQTFDNNNSACKLAIFSALTFAIHMNLFHMIFYLFMA